MAAGKTNWFAIWISVGVVAALVLVGVLVVWMNSAATSPGEAPQAANIDSETGAISVGDGPNQLATYLDFMCPHCQEFERVYGATIDELVESGEVTLDIHPVALSALDAASGTAFSSRSANAAYCVAVDAPDAVLPFVTGVFALDPSGPGLTDDELVAVAADAGAPGVAGCIEDRTYDRFVASMTRTIPADPATGSAGTPTVVLNGDYVSLTGNPQADLVAALR